MPIYNVHITQGFSSVVGGVEAESPADAAAKVWDSPNQPRRICTHCSQDYDPDGEPEVTEVVLAE